MLYNVIFPWIVLAISVGLPMILGITDGERSSRLSPRWRFGVLLAVVTTLAMLPQVRGFGLFLGASTREWIWQHPGVARSLSLITYWPLLYIIATRMTRHGRAKVVAS